MQIYLLEGRILLYFIDGFGEHKHGLGLLAVVLVLYVGVMLLLLLLRSVYTRIHIAALRIHAVFNLLVCHDFFISKSDKIFQLILIMVQFLLII